MKTLPTSGKTGATIRILGSNLTGATSVSFNGTAAAFMVVSRTLISATVPASDHRLCDRDYTEPNLEEQREIPDPAVKREA